MMKFSTIMSIEFIIKIALIAVFCHNLILTLYHIVRFFKYTKIDTNQSGIGKFSILTITTAILFNISSIMLSFNFYPQFLPPCQLFIQAIFIQYFIFKSLSYILFFERLHKTFKAANYVINSCSINTSRILLILSFITICLLLFIINPAKFIIENEQTSQCKPIYPKVVYIYFAASYILIAILISITVMKNISVSPTHKSVKSPQTTTTNPTTNPVAVQRAFSQWLHDVERISDPMSRTRTIKSDGNKTNETAKDTNIQQTLMLLDIIKSTTVKKVTILLFISVFFTCAMFILCAIFDLSLLWIALDSLVNSIIIVLLCILQQTNTCKKTKVKTTNSEESNLEMPNIMKNPVQVFTTSHISTTKQPTIPENTQYSEETVIHVVSENTNDKQPELPRYVSNTANSELNFEVILDGESENANDKQLDFGVIFDGVDFIEES
eukprot:313734_1